ncbi:protein of unknown function DUF3444 [Macleaya cordata]|uniref:DUF3444 domain-containing protein n=1 Tax=Macleaya cordata TaxID=56857 RepID=A0A200QQ45_MACCD|nr:protein of unknown function DUF3444 [Macleaya cordata]
MDPQKQKQQLTQTEFSNGRQTFWTACPFCKLRYQYYRNIVDKALICQNCMKPFIAYDVDIQGMPSEVNSLLFSQKNEVPSQDGYMMHPKSIVKNFPSSVELQGNLDNTEAVSLPFAKTGGTSEVGVVSNGGNTFWTECPFCNVRYEYYRNIVKRHLRCQNCLKPFIASDLNAQEMPLPAKQKKEGRSQDGHKMRQECIVKNFPSSMGFQGNLDNTETESPSFRKTRGTSEDGGDSKTKGKEYANGRIEDKKERKGCGKLDPKGTSPLQESLPNANAKANKACKKYEKGAAAADDNKEGPEVYIDLTFGLQNKPDPLVVEVPDPDFYDFDRDKSEECFAVDQMWAIYDDLDSMPRFYARIKKVYSPGFKVQITWLEPYPDDPNEIAWTKERLPIACGKFRYEKTEYTEEIGMFSHRVDLEKGTTRGSLRIYPRKGETWALFKNWDIKWSSDPDNHRNYNYDFVEVLSDYTRESGINVVYLVKVKGFVSLFKPTKNNGMIFIQIPPNELLRFSHRVPSFRMTGREREDVPEGYFELDPASLPGNLEEIFDTADVKVNVENINGKISGSSRSPAEKKPHMPKRRKNPVENDTMEGGNLKSGHWFPRLANLCNKKQRSEEKAGSDGEKSCDASTFGRESAFTCQADANEMGSDGVVIISDSVSEQSPSSASHLFPCEIREAEFYNFEDDKSYEKFKSGQIWALYCEFDSLPKYYAQIEKVELSPNFKLYVKWLEACTPPKGVIQWLDRKMPICCGTFTSGEKAEFDDTTSFSHLLSTGVSAGKENKYEIYPRKGEVWALYRNFNSDWTCSDLQKCEYDMVEVLEVYHDRWIIVLVLRQVAVFKTVFKAERNAGHDFIMGIPWIELFRLSHQVPAFRLTEPRYGSLRGCWELDPKSMAACLVPSN